MEVRRLECPTCGVGVDGRFDAGPLAKLSREQLGFVEVFLRNRGKIKDVEEDLGISYPTVVSKLNDVLVSLGFEAGEDPREGFQAGNLHASLHARSPYASVRLHDDLLMGAR
jgi:hypothetical protein